MTVPTRLLILTCFLPLIGSVLFAQESFREQESSPGDNPPARVARISYLKGDVSFLRAGLNQWSQATLNFPVTTDDRIYTDKRSRAELEVGSFAVRLSERTDLTITNLNDQIAQLGLTQGTLEVTIYELPSGNSVEVDTPNGALTFLAAGTYRTDVDDSGDWTIVSVATGSVQISGGDVSQILQGGQAVRLIGHDPIQIVSVPMPELDGFDKWCEERDEHLSSSSSARYVSRGVPGYDDLDTYGRWQDVPDYGPVWYPTGVEVGWVPYRFGRWVWVGPWGWTWVEDEPWGFCPFHFGRWVQIGVAWGWLPGPYVPLPVYAPALVAFVGGFDFSVSVGSIGLTAWFPLGPGEPYFPWYHYGGDYLRAVNITNIRNVTNTTNITNITNISEIHYKYRTVAATAVPADIFRNGQPVAHNVVRVPPQQLARASVVPHPPVNPTRRAAMPGRPVAAPPVRAARFAAAKPPSPAPMQPPGQTRSPAPLVTRNPTPEHSVRNSPSTSRTPPGPGRTQPAPLRTAPPGLITRNAPPALPRVPFTQEQRVMGVHPGRPLEPQQLQNLHAGRAPGPMLDREFPPHVAPDRQPRGVPTPQTPRPRRP